jgi:carbon monoxide dehydrogenase subunit G
VPRFEKTLQVSAPADRAWAVIGDLTVMGELAGATEVKVEGMTRVCTFRDGTVQHERISDYLPDQRSYRYSIEGGPLEVKKNQGSFAVNAADTDSVVVWEAEFEPMDPSQEQEMSEMWEGAMEQVLAGVKERIEAAS